jgi:hypothetical protein
MLLSSSDLNVNHPISLNNSDKIIVLCNSAYISIFALCYARKLLTVWLVQAIVVGRVIHVPFTDLTISSVYTPTACTIILRAFDFGTGTIHHLYGITAERGMEKCIGIFIL